EDTAILYREWLPQFQTALGGGQPVGILAELMAHYRGTPKVSKAGLTALALFSLFSPPLLLLGYGRLQQIQRLRSTILHSMGDGRVLLGPVFPTTAPRHGFAWKPNKSPIYTAVFNGLGFPAVAMPVGLSKQGLPLSVQLIGQPGEDETALAVAGVLEQTFGGYEPPSGACAVKTTDAH